MGKRVIASYCSSFLKPEMLHIYRQVKALHGVDTFVMTKELQNAERFPFPDIEIIPKQRMNLLRHGWLKFVKRRPPVVYRGEYQVLASLLARRGVDLMHIYFGHTGVHLLPFIKEWDKPCVVSFHGADVALKEDIANYPAKLCQLFEAVPLVLARSQSLADRLIQMGCPPGKLRINRTGVPLDEFPFVARQPPADGCWQIMQACRLIPKKGVATIFKDVHFIGFLSQRHLMELYAESHLFLHPSETPPDENQEGVPNSILEAMATGLPVAATQHGGIPEAVEHGRTGWLVPEEDHVALANAMQEITRSPRALAEMGLRARAAVAARFGQEAQIDQLESFYEEAIAMNAAAEPAKSKPMTQLAPQFAERVPAK